MCAQFKEQTHTSAFLRSNALQFGSQNAVKVNQRMLIDKMLARYSSDFVVCRELIQNADDAKATSFQLEILCTPTTSGSAGEQNFHHSTIQEIRATNNGSQFTDADWTRVASIAEGNTNVESIGQFGVGFFSVFSFSEEPIITSGTEYIAFVWQSDDSLTTFRYNLPVEQQTELTSVILKMRGKHLLDTETTSIDNNTALNTQSTIDGNDVKVLPSEVIPMISVTKLKAYFSKVLSFTKHITDLRITINDLPVFEIKKIQRILPATRETTSFKLESVSKMLRLSSLVQTEQQYSVVNGPSIILNHITVEAILNLDETFRHETKRILKKDFPRSIQIQLLFAPNNMIATQCSEWLENVDVNTQILNSLIPFKYYNQKLIPSGFLYIGLETHQTTGVGMHISSHFIPTIERENLDLQDPYLSKWNKELLAAAGQLVRFVYDQEVQNIDLVSTSLSTYSFQPSVPNNEIGAALLTGFFSSKEDIPVPAKLAPSISQLSILPSSLVYLAYSKHIHSFLSLPLVPFELLENGLFTALKQRGFIQEISFDLISSTISDGILLSEQFIELLHWLCNKKVNSNQQYIRRVLSCIRFRDAEDSPVVTLEKILHYDEMHVPSMLPLPTNVLPARIVAHVPTDRLSKALSLTPLSFDSLLDFYFSNEQRYLLSDQNKIVHIFHLISKHWTEVNQTKWKTFKQILASVKCIPTTQGMQVPKESYIRSPILSSELALITLNVVQSMTQAASNAAEVTREHNDLQMNRSDDRVLTGLLRSIGCRTINIQSYVNHRKPDSDLSQTSSEQLQMLVQHLLDEKKNMSEEDMEALKRSECFPGTTLCSTAKINRQFYAHELHFPWVATQLHSNTLLIIDWHDTERDSDAYRLLKDIGVREAPVLDSLIDMIIEDHVLQMRKNEAERYQLSYPLLFLAQNVEKHYPELWKDRIITRAFLPGHLPTSADEPRANHGNNNVQLMPIQRVFKNENPLCANLLLPVVLLFEKHFPLSVLGVNDKPSLKLAFEVLLERKEEILTRFGWARQVFAYMKDLEGLSAQLKGQVAELAFIPFKGNNTLRRPSEVFIDPDGSLGLRKQLRRALNNGSGSSDQVVDTSGLIDYVNFGPDGNTFLWDVGVCPYPSVSTLAQLLLDRQASFFNDFSRDSRTKVDIYIECLIFLENTIDRTNETINPTLKRRLENEPWCLGCSYSKTSINRNIFQIVTPQEICLVDDHNFATYFELLCPPTVSRLVSLYKQFGSKWLSQCVTSQLKFVGEPSTTKRTTELRDDIRFRLDILFVDKQGNKTAHLNDEEVKLIRETLAIYEVSAIQCHLTFRGKTIIKEDLHSCVVEKDRGAVKMFIQNAQREIKYIDIAKEIAHVAIQKPTEEQILSIYYKLTASIEELKRFGYPVELLSKSLQQREYDVLISEKTVVQQANRTTSDPKTDFNSNTQKTSRRSNNHTTNYDELSAKHKERTDQHDDGPLDDRKQKPDASTLAQFHSSHAQNSRRADDIYTAFRNLEKYVNTNECVPDFRSSNRGRNSESVKDIIDKVQPFDELQFMNLNNDEDSADNSCEAPHQANMKRYKDRFSHISLYIEEGVNVTPQMLARARQLGTIIAGLAVQVYSMQAELIHLYRDIDGPRIAFNHRGSLFINLRHFEQVFAERFESEAANASTPSSIIQSIVNSYFMIICHLLVHNTQSKHDAIFIYRLEDMVINFLPQKDAFLTLIAHC